MPSAHPELPLLDLAGAARERGRAHGEALRGEVARGLALAGCDGGAAGDSVDGHLAAAERWTPEAVEELRGIAEGAEVPFASLFAYNLADERRLFAGPAHCTTLGLRGGRGAPPLSGQTMDTPEWFADLRVAVRAQEGGTALTTLAFTVAGMPALCGVNSAGVSVWCNALYQLAPSAGGVPVACIVRRLLSSRSLAESRTFLARVPHACGQSYLIGSPEGVAALECSARGCDEVRAGGAAVWHANHPVGADPGSEPPAAGSLARDAFAGRTLPAASSAEGLRAILADTTVPVSKPGGAGGDSYTLWAVVAEHSLPPLVAATAGPPSASPWVSVGLAPAHVQG